MNGPLLILLEGANDLEFLVRLTGQLRRELPHLPDLSRWRAAGRIVLVPVGGGDPASWPNRLMPLGLPEFHLYDREQLPETNARQRAVDQVNARPDCHGALTTKRSLENYLHPQAIASAGAASWSLATTIPFRSSWRASGTNSCLRLFRGSPYYVAPSGVWPRGPSGG